MDIIYERGVKIVCLAEALPHELFDPGPGRRENMPDEVFAFGRTASRLTEMQSQGYLERCSTLSTVVQRRLHLLGGTYSTCYSSGFEAPEDIEKALADN